MKTALASILVALPLLALACATPDADATETGAQAMTAGWFAANIPAGSVQEKKVLALVNDSSMTEAKLASECNLPPAQAAAIMSHRQGDDVASTDDDEAFDDVAEIDAMPGTDAAFWSLLVPCAAAHIAGPPVCVSAAPVILELVVDESGSMDGDKWEAQRDALVWLFTGLLEQRNDPQLLVGAQLFDDAPTTSVKPRPLTGAGAGALQYSALVSLIDKPRPHGGSTGTEKALAAGLLAVDVAVSPLPPRTQKVVVLLTDGAPTGGDAEKRSTIDLLMTAHASGTSVFAIGIGDLSTDDPNFYDPAFLGRLAIAGGTAPNGCDPSATTPADVCHFQVTPGANSTATKQSLVSALNQIRGNTMCP